MPLTLGNCHRIVKNAEQQALISDVVMGAGVGILSTKLAYVVYPVIKTNLRKVRTSKVMFMTSYQPGTYGFTMAVWLNKKAK